MRFSTVNVKRLAIALLCGAALTCGTAYGQGRYDQRKVERRALRQHQKSEKRELKARQRTARRLYGNTSDWRTQRRSERTALRQHQRAERLAYKQRYNRGRHLGRGYYRAPGQRLYTARRAHRPRVRLDR